MTLQLPKRVGVLPWTNEPHELPYKTLAERLSIDLRLGNASEDHKWIVISPDPDPEAVAMAHNGQQSYLHHLELTATAFITYYARSEHDYDHVIWFGADNVAVTIHYLHQLATLRNISMKKNNVPRSLSDVVQELFEDIASKCSRQMKVLVVFSNANFFEESESRMEIQPFLPSKELQHCVDFMVMTLNPQNFEELPSAVRLLVPCRLGAGGNRVASNHLNQLDSSKDGYLDQLILLLSLLYPNNITSKFIQAAIEHMYQGDKVKTSLMVNLIVKLRTAKVLRQIKATNPQAYSIEREYQDAIRASTAEDDLQEMALRLQGFFEHTRRLNEKDAPCDLFSAFGTEAAMHQSWLATVAAVHVVPDASTSLLDKVVQYVNIQCVGRVFIQHRQELLGHGIYEVFKGYINEVNGGKREVAAKCMPNAGINGTRRSDARPQASLREIQSLMAVNSENIVRYILTETDGLCTYVVMELCDQTLGEWVKSQRFVDLEEDIENLAQRFKFLHDSTKGLDYLNDKKILHRDIKPSNILLKTDGATTVAKIADFGLSKPMRSNGSASVSRTIGTEDWVAPEMSTGVDATHMADMYSFGKVCYFVLSCGEKLKDNFKEIDFTFDFYGASKTIEALVSDDPTKRVGAKDLLDYPMFWIAESRSKFATFIIHFFLHFGNESCHLRGKLQNMPLDWRTTLTSKYDHLNVTELLSYSDRRSARRGETAFDFLRVSRNAIEHAREHRELGIRFVDQYYGQPPLDSLDPWKYFEIWYKPFPTLFFEVWKITNGSGIQVQVPAVPDFNNPQEVTVVAKRISERSAAANFETPMVARVELSKGTASIPTAGTNEHWTSDAVLENEVESSETLPFGATATPPIVSQLQVSEPTELETVHPVSGTPESASSTLATLANAAIAELIPALTTSATMPGSELLQNLAVGIYALIQHRITKN